MTLSRRKALALGSAAISISIIPLDLAFAMKPETQALVDEFTNGASVSEEGALIITAPEIAENGGAVPISVNAPGAKRIVIIAENNPNPKVITFNFGELSGRSEVSTRIRLHSTQDLLAVAELNDGSFISSAVNIKVTLGGC